MTSGENYDVCVIGGGIVGLASALALVRQRPGLSLVLVEKEDALARHQTGHNSNVVHTGTDPHLMPDDRHRPVGSPKP